MVVLRTAAGTERTESRRAGRPPSWRSRTPSFDPLALALAAGAAAAYASLSILLHQHLGSQGLDLGLFDQAIWHYSRLEGPESSIRGFPSLLGDHLHPILALLAPLYWLWDDVRMLLLAQAVLIAASILPVMAFARRRLGRVGALGLTAAYALSWGIQYALVSDFHEVAFAPLLIASAVYLADVRRLKSCLAVLGLLLLVKESFGIFVAFFGLYLLARREVRAGLVAFAAGVMWHYLATEVLMPYFNGGDDYTFWRFSQLGTGLGDALLNIVRAPWLPFEVMVDSPEKVRTLAFLALPFLGLFLLSPVAILAVPLVLERMLSTDADWWGTDEYHSLAIAAVLAMGAADGLRNLLRLAGARRVPGPRAGAALGVVLVGLSFAAPHGTPLARLVTPSFWIRTEEEQAAARAFAIIPEHDGSVAAQNRLLPHLSQRSRAFLIRPATPLTDYLVFDATGEAEAGPEVRARRSRYRTVFEQRGVTVMRRRGTPAP